MTTSVTRSAISSLPRARRVDARAVGRRGRDEGVVSGTSSSSSSSDAPTSSSNALGRRDAIAAIASLNAASISDPDKAAKKAKRWADIRNWLVVTSRITPDDELLTREDYAATCCAVQNMQLSFAADGVGCKWTSGDIQRTPEFERICGVDGDAECVCGVIWYGYAADGAAPAAPRRKLGVQEVLLNVP